MIDEKKLITDIRKLCSGHSFILKRFLDVINSQPQIGGWIPCSERLPEENQNVIACFAHGTVTELRFYGGEFHGIYDYNANVIVAWQPLPEKYQG